MYVLTNNIMYNFSEIRYRVMGEKRCIPPCRTVKNHLSLRNIF